MGTFGWDPPRPAPGGVYGAYIGDDAGALISDVGVEIWAA